MAGLAVFFMIVTGIVVVLWIWDWVINRYADPDDAPRNSNDLP